MRYFAYLFHGLLLLFLLGVSGLALATGSAGLQFGMLPWQGHTLNYVLFFGALAGLATLILALRRRLRALFFVWTALVPLLLLKGYILSGYKFAPGEWKSALLLVAASIAAAAGGWLQFRSRPQKLRHRYQSA